MNRARTATAARITTIVCHVAGLGGDCLANTIADTMRVYDVDVVSPREDYRRCRSRRCDSQHEPAQNDVVFVYVSATSIGALLAFDYSPDVLRARLAGRDESAIAEDGSKIGRFTSCLSM
jgi:hypothetical protein